MPIRAKPVEVGALAYAQGSDIHFAPGQYDPNSKSGQELLAHELTHVQQQQSEGRVKSTGQVSGMPLNDDKSLEKEADDMASKGPAGADMSEPDPKNSSKKGQRGMPMALKSNSRKQRLAPLLHLCSVSKCGTATSRVIQNLRSSA